MPASRNYGYHGPATAVTYSQHHRDVHDRIVKDDRPDNSYFSKIANTEKVAYICRAVGIPASLFNIDTPFPIEDWALSGDAGLLNCGLYLNDLRRQFYGKLLNTGAVPENSPAWAEHAKAEFWSFSFNFAVIRRSSGDLTIDSRVLN